MGGQRRNSVAELSEDDRQTVHEEWRNISRDFFCFSRGWIYQRLNGYDGNGKECEFTAEQKEVLRNALRRLSVMLEETADKI